MQQIHFLFIDLDGLLSSVREHLQLQPTVFETDYLAGSPSLDAPKVTQLLSGENNTLVICQRGVYRKQHAREERLFAAAGWDLSERRTIEALLRSNLSDVGGCEGRQAKTLVLGLGSLTKSVAKVLRSYFAAGWRAQVFCLRRKNVDVVDRLRAAHPTSFQIVYLDRLLKGLLGVVVAPRQSSNQKDAQQTQRPEHNCDRFVLMDLDNISDTLVKSTSLYRRVPQASCPRELRIDFRRLTRRVCGDTSSKVQHQVAAYHGTHPLLVQGLMSLQWVTKKQSKPNDLEIHLQYLGQLISSDSASSSKTLVLLMGDRALAGSGRAIYRGLLEALIAEQWHIEIHAWFELLGADFWDLRTKYPNAIAVKPLDEDLNNLVYLKRIGPDRRINTMIRMHKSNTSLAAIDSRASTDLSSLLLQIQELGRAVAEIRSSTASQTPNQVMDVEQLLRQQKYAFTRQLREQRDTFNTISEQLVQQARDARQSHQLVLEEREEMLTCPITHCLYESPVITACCGKTFSRAAVNRLHDRNQPCPWCRQTRGFVTYPNRDIANLVEQYRAELSALELARTLV
ncbi:unnamed protein product [Phytophthora lilii]|uniref:Unnamed protein product n=1 Tax=Phytophthora lilii TaxID=2077276 RepID=A0A9W7CFD2_9STRA|nr:unnamed protein product [Phytophthora lilii]